MKVGIGAHLTAKIGNAKGMKSTFIANALNTLIYIKIVDYTLVSLKYMCISQPRSSCFLLLPLAI